MGMDTLSFVLAIVEKAGSGIERMINALKSAGFPELKIEPSHLDFTLLFMKDIYTEEYLRNLGLNARQVKAVMDVKKRGRIRNRKYQEINRCSQNTASNNFKDLTQKGILKESGKKGAGSYYVI
ncbi:MAG: hypothetical protein GXO71_06635 [Caldiserica bacterium]|nr:hypothetical protein [Caldisericota bacterium]